MTFITDRKRATGHGSAKSGTLRHWNQTVSSVGLLILVPLFLCTFGSILGSSYANVVSYYSRPYPGIVAALTIGVGFMHFKNGVRMLIEDYVQGIWREIWIIALTCVSYGAAAAGIFAIVKLAL